MIKIKLKVGQKLFFISDTHYHHEGICRATTTWSDSDKARDFKSLQNMNDTIVKNINNLVGKDDILFHLGDWSFGGFEKIAEFRSKLNVSDIRIVLGNHDHHILNNKENIRTIFSEVYEGIVNMRLSVEQPDKSTKKYFFVMSHYPIASWENMDRKWMHLHGHVHLPPHQKLGRGKSMDVGIDGSENFEPYNVIDIIDILREQPIKHLILPSDHHTKELK